MAADPGPAEETERERERKREKGNVGMSANSDAARADKMTRDQINTHTVTVPSAPVP